MHDIMASAEPCEDIEPGIPSGRVIDEKGQLSLYQDARGSLHSVNSSRRLSYELWAKNKMPSFRRTTLTVLIVAFLTVAYAAVPVDRRTQDSHSDARATSFQELLNSVSDPSLHYVLTNVYKKYKQGVFREDRMAMQAVHNDNAAIATSLVELARRQNTNVTSVTVAGSSTADPVVVPTTKTATVTQTSGTDTVVVVNTETAVTPVQTTDPVQTTTPQVSSDPPSEPSSVLIPVPSSDPVQSVNSSPLPGFSQPASVSPSPSTQANPTSQADPTSQANLTPSFQAPGQTSANDGATNGKATAASSPSATTLIKTLSSTFTSASPGQTGASASAAANFAVTTESSSTRQIVYTTTLPDGSPSTVTSYTIIVASEVAGSSVIASPGLQNGAVDGTRPRGMGLVGSLAAALVFVIGIL
jgi:hypothetical protein